MLKNNLENQANLKANPDEIHILGRIFEFA
jgi:hypothetical protein